MKRLAAVAIFLALGAQSLVAQTRLGAVLATVRDEFGTPVPNVEVTIIRVNRVFRTDSAGRFLLSAPAGKLDVSFRRMSYAPVVTILDIPAGDTAEVSIQLGTSAQPLDLVEVRAKPDRSRELTAFENRRKLGIGYFITRRDIEDRDPLRLSDALRSVPGTVLAIFNGHTELRFARSGNLNCPPQFFLDGIMMTKFNLDDVPPVDIEGVELYPGAVGVPAEYNRSRGTPVCGTVLIWTRIPGTNTKKP